MEMVPHEMMISIICFDRQQPKHPRLMFKWPKPPIFEPVISKISHFAHDESYEIPINPVNFNLLGIEEHINPPPPPCGLSSSDLLNNRVNNSKQKNEAVGIKAAGLN